MQWVFLKKKTKQNVKQKFQKDLNNYCNNNIASYFFLQDQTNSEIKTRNPSLDLDEILMQS